MRLRALLLLSFLATGAVAAAQEENDFLDTSGRLSDEDFYREYVVGKKPWL